MKAIILTDKGTENVINHLVAYGISEIVVFCNGVSMLDKSYYEMNNVGLAIVNSLTNERTVDKLTNIKGSIDESFFVVYSDELCFFDIDEVVLKHVEKQTTITVMEKNNRLIAALCEAETLDYFAKGISSFEKEIIQRIAQDGELLILR